VPSGDELQTQQYSDGTTVNEVVNPQTGKVDGEIVEVDGVNQFEPESEVNANIQDPELAKTNEVDRLQADNAAKDGQQASSTDATGSAGSSGEGSGNPSTVYRGVKTGNPNGPNYNPGADVAPNSSGVGTPANPRPPAGSVDIDQAGTGFAVPGEGASVYSQPGALPGKAWRWWGTDPANLPPDLTLVRDPSGDVTGPDGTVYLHYQIEPVQSTPDNDYLNQFDRIHWDRVP